MTKTSKRQQEENQLSLVLMAAFGLFGWFVLYATGWRFGAFDRTYGADHDQGLAFGYWAVLVRIGHSWYGFARPAPQTDLIDSPFLNMMGLWLGLGSLLLCMKVALFGTAALDDKPAG